MFDSSDEKRNMDELRSTDKQKETPTPNEYAENTLDYASGNFEYTKETSPQTENTSDYVSGNVEYKRETPPQPYQTPRTADAEYPVSYPTRQPMPPEEHPQVAPLTQPRPSEQPQPVAEQNFGGYGYNYPAQEPSHTGNIPQTRPQSQNSYQPQGNTGEYQNGYSSYTWGNLPSSAPQTTPMTGAYHQANHRKPKKEKKKRYVGLKIVMALFCCMLVSATSIGGLILMIQTGVIDIESEQTNQTAAFTINRILQETPTETTPVGDGVSVLTPQEIAEKLIPSVVCIQVYQTQSGLFFGNNEIDPDSEFSLTPASQGSGIIYSKDGYIITNAHVVSGAANVKVITSEGLTFEAEIIGEDAPTDLAVIKIEPTKDLVPAEFGSYEDLKVADEVMAIGNPGGIEFNSTVTMGYVSALDREVTDSNTGYTMKCIQTDAAINPGNSGGALLNMYGQVVGINSSKISAVGYEGLGFAIPVDTAQPIVTDLMEHGYVKDRAMLGISGLYIDSMTARFYGMPTGGFYVGQLSSSEAKESGLLAEDIITAIDDNPITSSTTIMTYLLKKKPGETVKLTINRRNSEESVIVNLVLSQNSGE